VKRRTETAYAVGLEIENFAGTGELSGFDAAETTLSLSRIFEPSDLRSGRMSVASAQGDQLDNELDAQRLDLMTSLARRFLAVVYLQETSQLAQSSVAMWQEAADMAEVRERAGIAPEADRLRTELRLVNARLQVEEASHELQAARTSLAATWGDTTASYGQAIGELCGVQELAAFEEVAASLQRNPDMLRFANEQRLYEASAQLAEARRQPPWTLSAGVRRLEQFDDHAFVLGVTMPLGSPSRASLRSAAPAHSSEIGARRTRRATGYSRNTSRALSGVVVPAYRDRDL
jgi:cobalt-zinc-cadmium efflux system outer membrane protein